MFGSEKKNARRWAESVAQLKAATLTIQQFVNLNEKCPLWYSTPFGTDIRTGRERPYALSRADLDTLYLPVFTSAEACTRHFESVGRDGFLVIKGTLKDALASLDAHPVISSWGVVVDPGEADSVCIPPRVRVQPKALRD